jgi:ADP-ribosylglycohydrolase
MSKLEEINYSGCIIGGAIGDALGASIEFMSLESIIDKYGLGGVNDYSEFNNGVGEITDDTQMLLFTAEGLLRSFNRSTSKGIWGAYKMICYESYLRWLHTQNDCDVIKNINVDLNGWLLEQRFLFKRRAPGSTCLSALRKGKPGTIENRINDSKGCGGIMRIAPVGLLFHNAPKQAFQIGAELAAMTHGHPCGYLSAGFLAALIAFVNSGDDLMRAILKSEVLLKEYFGYEEVLLAVQNAKSLFQLGTPSFQKVETLGRGWVGEEALSISLYCALSFENDFEKAINLAINHSGDSDSTGSITGNIVGLIVGQNGIPKRWVDGLANHQIVNQIARDLHVEVLTNPRGEVDIEWGRKYPAY